MFSRPSIMFWMLKLGCDLGLGLVGKPIIPCVETTWKRTRRQTADTAASMISSFLPCTSGTVCALYCTPSFYFYLVLEVVSLELVLDLVVVDHDSACSAAGRLVGGWRLATSRVPIQKLFAHTCLRETLAREGRDEERLCWLSF